jgi:septum formation protein
MTKKYLHLNRLLQRYNLVLASGSPRRVKLLVKAGIRFRQIVPDIEEENDGNLGPYDFAVYLAKAKAAAVLPRAHPGELVLGCDTIVVRGDDILGKPRSFEEAVKMLMSLSGRRHIVCSAAALAIPGIKMAAGRELTEVYFKHNGEKIIRDYVATGEPMDKAGAYGIQERGVFLVDRVIGNIDNVIGLPLTLIDALAGKLADKKDLR